MANRDWLDSASTRFDWQAFLWTTGLFALEHNRWLAGAMAGAAYALLAVRCGLVPAIVAHSVTNLVLGIQVVVTGNWAFW
ncbi:MAG: CPBP family intramembrane metalloprotease [Lentisphaerae bacterium]|nr:CPBP family intramembrane metalloprotease [Lentisphaerota bacterium]